MKHCSMIRRTLIGLAVALLPALAGCGVLAAGRTSFSSQAQGSEGNELFREDIEAIVTNAQLTADQQRDALRELGIEDEDLIEALLTLP